MLVSLDTPGGLLDSTRTMVSAIERSPVPVCVYISPTGARGGSAGFFLLEAADIAAMAPGTNAGASHPIVEGRTLDPILKQKIENDTAAFLRSTVTPADATPKPPNRRPQLRLELRYRVAQAPSHRSYRALGRRPAESPERTHPPPL